MALAAAGISCELREVKLAAKPQAMLAISNKATVPVLQLDDGKVIDESLDLMHWALAQRDPEGWLTGDLPAMTALIQQNDSDFKQQLDSYKYHVRYPQQSQEYYRQQAEKFLTQIEAALAANNGAGLAGANISFADIAIFPFIRQFSRVDLEWFQKSPYHGVIEWLARIESSSLFLSIMKKYEPWEESRGNSYIFP